MLNLSEMENRIRKQWPDCEVRVQDLDGLGRHYEVYVVTDQFKGRSLLDRHRLIYSALGNVVGTEMHAAKVIALTCEEQKGRK